MGADATYYYDTCFGGVVVLDREIEDYYESWSGGESMFSYGSSYKGTDCYAYINSTITGYVYSYNNFDTVYTSTTKGSYTVNFNISYNSTYQFLYWRTDEWNGYGSDGGESEENVVSYNNSYSISMYGDSYYPDHNVSTHYYAVFLKKSTKYTVRYYYWGSSGDTYVEQTCYYGSTYYYYNYNNISLNTSYGWQNNWVGWASSSSATSSSYSAGGSFSNLTSTNGGIVNRYAITRRTVYLSYSGNGNTGGSTSRGSYSYQYGNLWGSTVVTSVSITVASNGFSRNGYTFSNWNTASGGGGTSYSPGNSLSAWGSYSTGQTYTLHAQWTENVYQVDVNVMSPSGVQDYASGSFTYYSTNWGNTQSGCTDQPYDRVNYTGYIQISNISPATGMHLVSVTCGHGTISSSGGTYTYRTSLTGALSGSWDDAITIQMAWNTYTVRYYHNSESHGDTYTDQSCTYGTSYNYYNYNNFNLRTANGWDNSWVGWTTNESSTSVNYSGGASFSNLTATNGGIVTRYAVTRRTVYLAYNGNGATGGSTATGSTTQYGNLYGGVGLSSTSIAAANNGFTRTGYSFSHWGTNTSGGTTYAPGASVSLWTSYNCAVTQNLYANWSLITHTVTIYPYLSNTNGLSYERGVPGSYTVTASGGTSSSTSVSVTDGNTKTLTVSVLTGHTITVSHNFSSSQWKLMGIYTSATTPTSIQTNPTLTVSNSANTNVYVYFTKNSANKLKYTTDNGGYFYFEDGVYPQSKVTGVTTSGTASGRTYNIAGTEYSGYTVGGQEYVCVNSIVFKVEPIRWRVSDYGVSSTAYPSKWSKYGSFNTGFTAVTDKVLSVGSAMTKEQYNNATWNNWSLTSSSLPSLANSISVSYAKNATQTYDKFGGVASVNVVSGTASASGNVRIASKTDLTNAGFTDYDARATDLVKYLLNCGTHASYWTTNLGTQYGAGQVMSTGNLTKDKWLYENAGLRFAITFNEGVRHIGGGISEYQRLQYIESTGTQYIDLGWSTTTGMIAEYSASWNSGSYIVSSHSVSSPYGRNYGCKREDGYWELGYGNLCPVDYNHTGSLNTKYNVKFSTINRNAYLEVEGERYLSDTTSQETSPTNVYFFGNAYSLNFGHELASAKLYMAKIYGSDGVLIRDLIPCKRLFDGVVGMYDLVNDVFYTNGGTGSFVAKEYILDETTFTGSNYVALGRDYMYEDKITINLWAYMDNWANYNDLRIISCTEDGGWNIESSSTIGFAVYDSGYGYRSVYPGKTWSSLGSGWHMFTMTFDGEYYRVYIDGLLLATSERFTSGKIGYNSTNGIFVGAEAEGNATNPVGQYFVGKVKNLNILNSTMSANEIESLYERQK